MNDYSNFIGKVLDKRYKILEVVGVGGMATVLRAQDLLMNRIVAIKILNDEFNGNELAENRFMDESKAVAMLSHKNIVSIYDVAIFPDIKYIVMEYIDGITLREYLDNKGALPWNEACIYVLQVLRALEHAHSKGVIHRDIKPQNIILQKNGEIKVMDFGIAKIPTSASVISDKAVGTVYYISPEQASGKETGAYSDLYSVGILLYEAVTGTLPFKADSPMAVAAMQVNDEPQNPRDLVLSIPVGVSQIILKAMMKNPDDRFRSAHSMTKAIEWVLRNPDVIFSLSEEGNSTIGDTNVVSIDMIDTAEIKPYGEDEIAQSLGVKAPSDKEKEQKRKEQKEQKANEKSQKAEKRKKEKKKKKKNKRSTTMFPIISGIFFPFLLIAITLAMMLGITFVKDLFFKEDTAVKAIFPDIRNKTFDSVLISQLENQVYGAKFRIDDDAVTYTNNPDYADGVIIATEPEAGTQKKSTEDKNKAEFHFTKVLVNKITTATTVPDVAGYTKADAKVLLTNNYGFNVNCIEFIPEPDPALNIINDNQITRSSPAAGEPYHDGDIIVLYICQREVSSKTAPMPNCVGLTPEKASRLCKYSLYNVEIVEEFVIGGTDKITAQSVKQGTVSDRNTTVTLTVSRPSAAMPKLTGMPLQEAFTLLGQMGITDYTYEIYSGVIEGAVNFTDSLSYETVLQYIEISMGTRNDWELKDTTTVVFQSIPEGADPGNGVPLILVAVNYEAFIY